MNVVFSLIPILTPVLLLAGAASADLRSARDRQDRDALRKMADQLSAAAQAQPTDAPAQYHAALAHLYLAEVALEVRQKNDARAAAETGIRAAQAAVRLKPDNAEYHRVLGTLCGQVIPANVIAGLKYGKCALESVNKAIELDPKSSDAYLSRAVGNYYLPPSFGGGIEAALKDLRKALELNPKSSEAYLWLGVVHRKANQNKEARQALEKSLQGNPKRVWAKELIEKTPE